MTRHATAYAAAIAAAYAVLFTIAYSAAGHQCPAPCRVGNTAVEHVGR